MRVERRISASFKDIPGGQILGASSDYTHRLIDSGLLQETDEEAARWVEEDLARDVGFAGDEPPASAPGPKVPPTGAIDYIRSLGLLKARPIDDAEPRDVTKRAIEFPASRSERLQILARGQTGAVTALGYAALRGYGATLHRRSASYASVASPSTCRTPLRTPQAASQAKPTMSARSA